MNIKQLREAKGWTQAELARRVGVRQTAISRLERGVRLGRVQTLRRLAAVLEVDLETLLAPPRRSSPRRPAGGLVPP